MDDNYENYLNIQSSSVKRKKKIDVELEFVVLSGIAAHVTTCKKEDPYRGKRTKTSHRIARTRQDPETLYYKKLGMMECSKGSSECLSLPLGDWWIT